MRSSVCAGERGKRGFGRREPVTRNRIALRKHICCSCLAQVAQEATEARIGHVECIEICHRQRESSADEQITSGADIDLGMDARNRIRVTRIGNGYG